MKNKVFLSYAFAFGGGCLSALAMAPLNGWYVLFFTVAMLFVLFEKARGKKQFFFLGWLFGFGYFLCSLSWIGSAVLVEDNGYRWAYPLAIAGIPFLLSFYWGLAGCLYSYARSLPIWGRYLSFAGLFGLFEVLRGYAFTGFPWNLFGYAWADHLAIVQSTHIFTVYGLTILTWFWAAIGGALYVARRARVLPVWALLCTALASFVLIYGYGHMRLKSESVTKDYGVRVQVVSGDIPQEIKWKRDHLVQNFLTYVNGSYLPEGSDYSQPSVIVWPETAIADWMIEDIGLRGALMAMLAQHAEGSVILTGMLRFGEDDGEVYNSLVQIDQDGRVSNIYNKSHLVPFGEYIPFSKYIPLPAINKFSGFVPGNGAEVFVMPNGQSYAPAVCYEIIFPHSLLPGKTKRPDFIVNVTNDAWYYGSAGPSQHYVHAMYRAVEYGIPVVRVANRGQSALINPYGNIH